MEFLEFDSFRSELRSLDDTLARVPTKTVRLGSLQERFRTLFRVWASTIQPALRPYCQNTKEFFKLAAEIERLAQLASKFKPVAEYRRRVRRALNLANSLILSLPSPKAEHRLSAGGELFVPGIPDVPVALVPNPILGWRSRIDAFLQERPFDRSVFIMIRYRKRNESLITSIKGSLHAKQLYGVIASEHNLTDDLYNPVACLLCCSRGIAVFDKSESGQIHNPNVAYELGMLHLLNRPCLILKHRQLKSLQSDILMKLYMPYTTAKEAARIIQDW